MDFVYGKYLKNMLHGLSTQLHISTTVYVLIINITFPDDVNDDCVRIGSLNMRFYNLKTAFIFTEKQGSLTDEGNLNHLVLNIRISGTELRSSY